MEAPEPTHYDVLGVRPGATAEEIRRAYRARVKAVHPDAGGDPAAFVRLREAHLTLSDPDRRRDYDRGQGFDRIAPGRPGGGPSVSGPNVDEGFTGDVSFPAWLRATTDAVWEGHGERDAGASVPTVALEVAWRWDGPVTGRPVPSAGGGLLVPSGEAVAAIDTATGATGWRAGLAAEVAVPPLHADGTVVVWTADGDVHGLEPRRGITRWQHRIGLPSAPAVATGEAVLLPRAEHRLDALSHITGRRLWSAQLAGAPAAVVPEDGAAVVIGDDTIESVDLRRGRHRWRHGLPLGPDFPPVQIGDTLLIGEAGGTLCRVDARTGAVGGGWDVGSAMAGLTTDGGRVLVTTARPPQLIGLRTSGRVLWAVETGEIDPEPAVIGRHGFLLGRTGHLLVVDLVDGTPVASAETALRPTGPPIASTIPGHPPLLLVRGDDARLTALVVPRLPAGRLTTDG